MMIGQYCFDTNGVTYLCIFLLYNFLTLHFIQVILVRALIMFVFIRFSRFENNSFLLVAAWMIVRIMIGINF